MNAPGLPLWLVCMRVLRRRPTGGPVLRLWDRLVVPVARAVEQRRDLPFGQSILAVARA